MRKVIRNGVPAEIRAVIFDMDGVIFDSERGVYECWKELERKYGFGNVDEPYKKSIGVSWAQTKENMLEHYGPDFPYDVYRQEQSRMYHERFDNGRLPMKPGPLNLHMSVSYFYSSEGSTSISTFMVVSRFASIYS